MVFAMRKMGENTNHHIHTNNADLFKGSVGHSHFIFEMSERVGSDIERL